MGIGTVFNKCTQHYSDEAIAESKDELIKNIEKHKKKFEKSTFTWWNEGQNMAMYNMFVGHDKYKGLTADQIKREFFEQQKIELIRRHLEFLCDLFDYNHVEKKSH